MEKKEPIKVSLPVFISIVVLFVALIFGFYMYMQNQKLEKEIAKLQESVNQSQTTKDELQEKLNSISNIANSEKEGTKKSSSTENTTQEIRGVGYTAKLDNDTIKITLKSTDGLWTDSDFSEPINNKTYTVLGLKKGIKKIVAVNRGNDVSPEVFVLMNNGDVYSVSLTISVLDITLKSKNPNDIKLTAEKIEEYKDIVDIYGYEDGHYVVDKNGKKITIYEER